MTTAVLWPRGGCHPLYATSLCLVLALWDYQVDGAMQGQGTVGIWWVGRVIPRGRAGLLEGRNSPEAALIWPRDRTH